MLPDRVSNPGPLTYESDALPIALRGPAVSKLCDSRRENHGLSTLRRNDQRALARLSTVQTDKQISVSLIARYPV